MAIADWKDLCIDATDVTVVGRFWGTLLGLELQEGGDAVLRGDYEDGTIVFSSR